MGNNVIAEDAEGEAAPENEENKEAAIFPVTIATIVFQIVMLFASFYYGMLFTNWGNMIISESEEPEIAFDNSTAPMWIKIVSQWLTITLYIVSVSLPICCPDRII